MVIKTSNACAQKTAAKRPHRRATVDTPSLSRPRPRRQRRPSLPLPRSVCFSEQSEVCVYAPPPSPSDEWYSGDDHARFKRERVSDVVAFREHARIKSDGPSGPCCPVGVEQLLNPRGMLEARDERKMVIQSVLVEQRCQRSFGVRDPVHIARLSAMLSAGALSKAQQRGRFQRLATFME